MSSEKNCRAIPKKKKNFVRVFNGREISTQTDHASGYLELVKFLETRFPKCTRFSRVRDPNPESVEELLQFWILVKNISESKVDQLIKIEMDRRPVSGSPPPESVDSETINHLQRSSDTWDDDKNVDRPHPSRRPYSDDYYLVWPQQQTWPEKPEEPEQPPAEWGPDFNKVRKVRPQQLTWFEEPEQPIVEWEKLMPEKTMTHDFNKVLKHYEQEIEKYRRLKRRKKIIKIMNRKKSPTQLRTQEDLEIATNRLQQMNF